MRIVTNSSCIHVEVISILNIVLIYHVTVDPPGTYNTQVMCLHYTHVHVCTVYSTHHKTVSIFQGIQS